MRGTFQTVAAASVVALLITVCVSAQQRRALDDSRRPATQARNSQQTGDAEERQNVSVRDPAAEAVAVREVQRSRPEQQITDHDRSPTFDITKPAPISMDLTNQPKQGRITGFDFGS
jgi:hypothetical protein